MRYGALNEGTSRLILTAKGPFAVDKVDVIANEDGQGFRLVADISASSDRKFDQALADQAQTTGSTVSTPKGDRVGKPAADPGKRFTLVIDAGHGGIDGGAEGHNGTVEKSITLAFALELRNKLATTGKYDVYLTRDDGRVPAPRRARAHRAPARSRPVHFDSRRHDQPQGHPRRHRLYGFRQGVRRRSRGDGRSREPVRHAGRHR